ncbi:MAG: tetratricopeptide repeat protein, partial [Myxococcota bacterium]
EIQQRLIDAHPRKLSLWESLRHSARAAQDWTTVATACDRLAEALDGEVRAQLLEEGAVVRIDHLGDELGAMQRLREVLKFDAARPLAYGRLHDLLVRRSATTELLALVTARIEAVDDFEDLAELYYEQARLQRALGNRDTALAVIDNLMMLDEHHVGGLALAAEIFVSLERFEAAIERLQLLAAADVPPRQQRIARLGAADFLSTKLDRHEAALAELDRLIHAGIDNLSVHIKIAKVARSAEHWDRAAEALATAASLTEGDQRADLSVKAARIHRKHRKDSATAVQSLRYALTAVADHLEAGEELASTLTHPSEVREFCRSFEDAVRHKLSSNPYDSGHLRKLAAVARWRDEHHLEQAVLQILDAIGLSTHEEQQNVDLHPDVPRPGPKGASPEDLFEELRLPRSIRGSSFDQLAKLSALTLEPIDDLMNRTLEAATVTRKNLIPSRQPHPLRDALHNCSVLLNAGPVTEVYFGGNEPKGIRIYLGRRKKGAIVFGASVQTPLDARGRFLLGRQLVGLRCSSLHLIDRSPREAAMLLHATAAASEVKLDTASRYPELPRYRDALQKSLSRRQRRAIAEVITSLSDHIKENDQIFEQWCETVRKEANRGGLMLAGDIRPAVQALFGADHTLRHLQENKEATDMVGFWLASDTLRLRRNMSVAR